MTDEMNSQNTDRIDPIATPEGQATEPETPTEPTDPAEFDLGPRLHRLARLMRRTHGGRRGPGPSDGTRGQGRVLALLALHSPIAQRELAYLLGVRPQSMGELLAKLEGIGLIRRVADPQDARARLVELTDAGRAAADELAQRPTVDPLAPLSDEERAQFADMLERIIAGLEETLGEDPEGEWDRRRGFGPGFGPEGFGRPGFDPRTGFDRFEGRGGGHRGGRRGGGRARFDHEGGHGRGCDDGPSEGHRRMAPRDARDWREW